MSNVRPERNSSEFVLNRLVYLLLYQADSADMRNLRSDSTRNAATGLIIAHTRVMPLICHFGEEVVHRGDDLDLVSEESSHCARDC